MNGRHLWIVAYDITDPKRLRRTYKTMRGYGDALQYSVFQCELSAKEKELMVSALEEIIHHHDDRVLLVDLGPLGGTGPDRVQFLGRPLGPREDGPVVF